LLTAAEDDRDVVRAMRLGARGVVLKQSASDLLLKSIRQVHDGEIWLDNRMTAEVIDAFKKSAESGQRREKPLLSDREKEVVQLVVEGFRNRVIGEKLSISEQTVKNHLHNIFDKLGVSDRLELALYAIHHKLVDQALPKERFDVDGATRHRKDLCDTGLYSPRHRVGVHGCVRSSGAFPVKSLSQKLLEKPTSGYTPTLLSSNPVANGFNPL